MGNVNSLKIWRNEEGYKVINDLRVQIEILMSKWRGRALYVVYEYRKIENDLPLKGKTKEEIANINGTVKI